MYNFACYYSCIAKKLWYFIQPNRNQTKRVGYIFLKTKIEPNLVGNPSNRSVRFGQGISPLPQAKCLGHFASGSGEMAPKPIQESFHHSHWRNDPLKKSKNLLNHKIGIFKKKTTKVRIFLKTTKWNLRNLGP